ncbi:HAD family hydrolase [Brochothrix thermosphacta]|uniref:HAD family hydrolase n=1 Tax=Brochothrix thermosphacta TaxID=2756 RepID=UPI000D79F09E|nr:HAD family hydrolase [Brochothrix thermosphacta]SPN74551.1 putative hydrolase HAD-superfamily [Brochothrix thermosphacta]
MTLKHIKTIVTDMDGTALTSTKELHPITLEAFAEWQAQGGNLIMATGRLDLGARLYASQLNIKLPVISCNGALIRDWETGKVLYKNAVPMSIMEQTVAIAKAHHVPYHIYTTERLLSPELYGTMTRYVKMNEQAKTEDEKTPYTITPDILGALHEDEAMLKMLVIIEDNELLNKVRAEFLKLDVETVISGPNLLDVMVGNSTKGAAVEWLAEHGYLELETTLTCGDNENDISMLQSTPQSLAMCNAKDVVKEAATFISEVDSNEGGVGRFVKQHLLG